MVWSGLHRHRAPVPPSKGAERAERLQADHVRPMKATVMTQPMVTETRAKTVDEGSEQTVIRARRAPARTSADPDGAKVLAQW